MRTATIMRKTKETDFTVSIDLDGTKNCSCKTGISFFNHMLTLFAFHAGFDLAIVGNNDLEIDAHHTVEDVGLTLGQAFRKALGDELEINRFGESIVPMDESLSHVVIDISGRPYLIFQAEFKQPVVGDMETELIREFFKAFVQESKITLHIINLYGENTHHISESIYKSFGRAIAQAVHKTAGGTPSTKGVL